MRPTAPKSAPQPSAGNCLLLAGRRKARTGALPGTVIATNTDTHEHHSVSVGSDGRYSLHLPPGNYTIAGRSPSYGDDAYLCAAQQPIRITAAATAHADVICEER